MSNYKRIKMFLWERRLVYSSYHGDDDEKTRDKISNFRVEKGKYNQQRVTTSSEKNWKYKTVEKY